MLKYVMVAIAAGVALVYFGIISMPDPGLIEDRVADIGESASEAAELIEDRVADIGESASEVAETIQNDSTFVGLTGVVNDTKNTIAERITP